MRARGLNTQTYRQELVKGVSGYALPGQTCYIMGSSGAGKTTLLNILSDRIVKNKKNVMSGKVMLNDKMELT